MGILLGIDYGSKRIGISQTDIFQKIASGLGTVESAEIFFFLKGVLKENRVEKFIIGLPRQRDNTPSPIESEIVVFIEKLRKEFPTISIERYDERFTTKISRQALLMMGVKKQKRRNKNLVNTISAVLILQSYLEFQKNNKK